MHGKKIPLTLIHNESAGDASHDRDWLVGLLARAGYDVDYHRYDPARVAAALDGAAELVAVAGGDGSVARVIAQARPDAPPIAILPLGTANNLATALGLGRDIEQLVAGWRRFTGRPFYPIDSEGPWGSRQLVEGLGFGAIEEAIAELPDTIDHESACRAYADEVMTDDPELLELTIDGTTIRERFAVLEIATIPLVGPNLRLAPAADPSTRKFSVSFIRDTDDERRALARWILAPKDGTQAPLMMHTATRMTIAGRFQRVRIDGNVRTASEERNWDLSVPITLEVAAEPVRLLLPG
ncbi:MAG: diacylglycerol kinase family protein [Alphaproteobacteria bacterium]